jgi:glycine cleavage system H protein
MGSFIQDLVPEDARLVDTHEFVLVEDDRARIGISHFAAEQLGDVVYVELPDIGEEFDKGDTFGSIESVKAASDLYMPVSGEIVAVNTALNDESGLVNDDCYGDGWMIEVKLTKPEELESLMTPQQYFKFLEESES